MKTFYCVITTLTAFLCLNSIYVYDKNDLNSNKDVKVQHYDMSDHVIFINVKNKNWKARQQHCASLKNYQHLILQKVNWLQLKLL